MESGQFWRRTTVASGVALLVWGWCAANARAQSEPAFSYTQGAGCYVGSPLAPGAGPGYTHGWEFVANSRFRVDALAIADTFAAGFNQPHTAYLWTASGTLLRSVSVAAGPNPGGTLGANDYRYFDIDPIELQAGQSYIVSVGWPSIADVFQPGDFFYCANNAINPTFDPRITFTQVRFSGVLNVFPNQVTSANLNLLAACSFRVAPVPPCAGDLNGDRAVTTADLTVFLGQFGTGVPLGTGADFVPTGLVDTADLAFFLGRFGTACP
ncbi:MAG: DUF4082 domain-containing protein [Planctomycetes bacterium]|nr:DUF4082 domain-containing protein [Planctomycetota bacterium]